MLRLRRKKSGYSLIEGISWLAIVAAICAAAIPILTKAGKGRIDDLSGNLGSPYTDEQFQESVEHEFTKQKTVSVNTNPIPGWVPVLGEPSFESRSGALIDTKSKAVNSWQRGMKDETFSMSMPNQIDQGLNLHR